MQKVRFTTISLLIVVGLTLLGCSSTKADKVSSIKNLPTKICFGSCSKQDKPQPILNKIVSEKPELFIYLGDNIYADTEDMKVLQSKYDQLGQKKEFQNLRQNMPVIATWDDHDYGKNDAGKEYRKKKESKEIFLNFWNEPADTERRKRPGIYTHYTFKDKGRVLQVILLDTRTFRDSLLRNKDKKNPEPPYKNDYRPHKNPNKTFLGKEQWEWLEERFKEPADLRIIGSSNQFSHEYNGWESWTNVPLEQEKMFSLIRKTKANGVVFVSGDVHWGEVSRRQVEGAYPVYDVTSSGLTETWKTIEDNKYRVGKPCRTANYGMIQIDWEKKDLNLQIRDAANKVVTETLLKLSDISFK